MPNFERMSQWFKDVSRRAERVPPFGERTAQRHMLTPTEIFGVEDTVNVSSIVDGAMPRDMWLAFNGVSGDIEIPTANDVFADTNGGGMAELWIRVLSDGEGSQGAILESGLSGSFNYSFRTVGESDGRCNLQWRYKHAIAYGVWSTTNLPLMIGHWHHVVVLYNRGSVSNDPTFFVDSFAIAASDVNEDTTPNGASSSGAATIRIANSSADTRTFHGDIADFKLWQADRTVAGLHPADQYRFLTGNETDLSSYFRIDEGVGTNLDNRTTESDGTITSGTWDSVARVGEGKARASEVFVLFA